MCVCVVQSTVLVSNILLDVTSSLSFELLAVGGTPESTEGRAEEETDLSKDTKIVRRWKVNRSVYKLQKMFSMHFLFSPPTSSVHFVPPPPFFNSLFSLGGGGVWPLSGG